ncbi:hypothetical protein AB0D13_36435 [Streptomyces sp. NPDC048430]|uniref:hypothetical protein n=1 Tax=unclassified Streptomyces TaxID=2593676 RepID=UPI003416BB70
MKRFVVPTLLAASLLTGCSGAGESSCTLVGMDSEVSLVWHPSDFGTADAATFRFCAGEVCEQRKSGDPDDPFNRLSIPIPQADGPGPVPVRLTVTATAGGKKIVSDQAEATLEEQHPNGKDCEPTAWTASFRAEPVGLTDPKGLPTQ